MAKTVFKAVVSGAELKAQLARRKEQEARRDEDIQTVREFLSDEMENRSAVEGTEYLNAAGEAVAAFERLTAWMLRE